MNLDDLRKKARGGDLEPEPDKPCDFEGCENFATYKDEEGGWCHTHRVKMIRETVTRGVSDFGRSAVTSLFTGHFAATCAVSPSPPIPASTITKAVEEEKEKEEDRGIIYIDYTEKKGKKKSKAKKAAKKALAFAKGFAKGMIEDEPEGTKK